MKGIASWSEHYRNRRRVAKEIGRIWDVPIVKRRMDRLVANVGDESRVLEVGAGNRNYGKELQTRYPNLYYKSVDIDRSTEQDYYSVSEVNEEYDFIFMFELIEHLELLEGLQLLEELRSKLKMGGKLLLSTPNLYHPHQYFGDSTHVTFYKYQELGGLMMTAGFRNIKAFRIYNDAFHRRIFRLYIGIYLHKFLDMDFARAVLLEGENC